MMEKKPSSPVIEAANTVEEETLAATQGSSKSLQGMPKFLSLMKHCISLHANFLEQETFTVLCHHLHTPLMCCAPLLRLAFGNFVMEEISFQCPMKCKGQNMFWEDGSPCWGDTKMQDEGRHP